MINVEFLRNGGSLICQEYIEKNRQLEEKIKKNLDKRRMKYLKMSNALKELLKNEFKIMTNKNI